MRILLVRSKSTGGIGVHVDSLARGLRAAGHQVVVLEATGRTAMRSIRGAARKSDVVHAHGLRAGAAACLSVRLGKRVVVTLHNAAPSNGQFLERIIARRADVVLGASQDLVERASHLRAKDVRFAPVVAILGPATRTREEVRAELGLADDMKVILAVGRLAPQKDYATLLDAARRVDRRQMVIAIAGDGPLRADLQGRIEAEDLPVRLLGHRGDVPDLLGAADAFVMCSTWEARPLALQEAMRAGMRCVATQVGGIPELVGDAALTVPPGDSERLFAALLAAVGSSRSVLDSPPTSLEQAATWPGPAEELAAALAAYRS